mmetsp:Transcript_20124/g.50773  ORF Transcript_20124/g.50773 Transcript_20124/m.50773 type:complete len:316 (+) Transcript_20124:4475-5422(+)
MLRGQHVLNTQATAPHGVRRQFPVVLHIPLGDGHGLILLCHNRILVARDRVVAPNQPIIVAEDRVGRVRVGNLPHRKRVPVRLLSAGLVLDVRIVASACDVPLVKVVPRPRVVDRCGIDLAAPDLVRVLRGGGSHSTGRHRICGGRRRAGSGGSRRSCRHRRRGWKWRCGRRRDAVRIHPCVQSAVAARVPVARSLRGPQEEPRLVAAAGRPRQVFVRPELVRARPRVGVAQEVVAVRHFDANKDLVDAPRTRHQRIVVRMVDHLPPRVLVRAVVIRVRRQMTQLQLRRLPHCIHAAPIPTGGILVLDRVRSVAA